MSFSLNIFSTGGGPTQNGISKYATAAQLPVSAADGDVAIVLDTNVLYSYDTASNSWVVIGGPGVAITVTDTASIDLNLSTNILQANLALGSTTLPANTQGISLVIQTIGTTGLYGYFPAGPISEVTSSVLQFSGPGKAVGFSFGIRVNLATGSTPGYLSAADWTTFNAKVGISGILQTVFPIIGGTNLPANTGITLSIPVANGTTGGYLSATDWTTFNNKLSVGATIAQLGNIAANSFLGNNTGAPAAILALTVTQTKVALGISGNNFGDVTLGAFLAATSTLGATLSLAQVLSFTEAQTTSPGMVSANAQTWNGVKTFASDAVFNTFIRFAGGSQVSWGSTATAGFTLMWSGGQGGTFSLLRNNGLGLLDWTFSDPGFYRSVSAAATLAIQDRTVEVTTAGSNLTYNIGYAATGNTGVWFEIMKVDSGIGSVTIQSPDLINGVTNFTFASQWEVHKLKCNGVGWRILT